jgi:hypothetical protein
MMIGEHDSTQLKRALERPLLNQPIWDKKK